jgi:hypothetical protein
MDQATYGEQQEVTGWVGWIVFAGTMMIVGGVLNVVYGLIAAINDDWVVFGNRANLYLDLSEWGWIHMGLGVIVTLAGIFLFTGNILARTVGVIVAAVSILANFVWMPVYPVWSLIVVTLDVLVIWALTAHGAEMKQA